jgi:hypothetical protein
LLVNEQKQISNKRMTARKRNKTKNQKLYSHCVQKKVKILKIEVFLKIFKRKQSKLDKISHKKV